MKHLTTFATALFMATSAMADGDYPLNFNASTLKISTADRVISSVTFASAGGTGTVSGWRTAVPFPVYADATKQVMMFRPGETIYPQCVSASKAWMFAYVYIDYNQNGQFDLEGADPCELVTQTTNGESYATIPSFTLPDDLADGDYRVRFKTDWDCTDPGGRYGSKYKDNFIHNNRGQIIDFTLRIDRSLKDAALREETEHCVLYAADGKSALPTSLRGQESLTFKVIPMKNYVLDGTLDVVSDAGTVSFSEIPSTGKLTAAVEGNTLIRAHFRQGPKATWHCIFNDEFNRDNYTWNPEDWNTTTRSTPTWARFNSNDPKDSVAVQNNGYLSLTSKTISASQMRTGNLMTQNLHNFTYGRVEARCKVYPHTGNFPAFWMMPAAQKPNYSGSGTWGGWPHSGEIDIMEQINNENIAYHTIHSHYANGAGDGGLGQTYQKTKNEAVDMSTWHIYALEWEADQLRWYVDGKKVHQYDRIAAKDNDQDRQWPFDRPFYVIINQSVGNGSWAASPDFSHQYRMDVDYVRIYQVCEPDGIAAPQQSAVQVAGGTGRIIIDTPQAKPVQICSVSGATVFQEQVEGVKVVALPAGIYIAAGKKVVVK